MPNYLSVPANILWALYINYLNLWHSFTEFGVFYDLFRIILGIQSLYRVFHYFQIFVETFMGSPQQAY